MTKEQLEGIWQFLDGKKTYIISFVVAVLSALTAAGIEIPTWVLILLTAGGITTSRFGATGIDHYYADEVQKLKDELAKVKALAEKR